MSTKTGAPASGMFWEAHSYIPQPHSPEKHFALLLEETAATVQQGGGGV